MTYKRQVSRLPIIPADAKEHNVTCHYCIVGCGYKAYTWPINKQGTATSNKFGVDLSQQRAAGAVHRPHVNPPGLTTDPPDAGQPGGPAAASLGPQ